MASAQFGGEETEVLRISGWMRSGCRDREVVVADDVVDALRYIIHTCSRA